MKPDEAPRLWERLMVSASKSNFENGGPSLNLIFGTLTN